MRDREISQLRSETDRAEKVSQKASVLSVRVSPHGYLSSFFVGSFVSAFLFYLEQDVAGLVVFILSWIFLPFFAFRDRVVFDGRRLMRTGDLPRFWAWLTMSRKRLRLSDIEQVETLAIRVLRRGGNIRYRYLTIFRGKGLSVGIASGGDSYRQMVKVVLGLLPENALDNRSIEIRDHLADPKEALMRAEFSRIPAADVLETQLTRNPLRAALLKPVDAAETEAEDLRTIANELRLGGFLLQALEAFRRALVLNPMDAKLLFEFARCLHSVGEVRSDKGLRRRALAASRLSERRGQEDSELLARIGEWYFQVGDWHRAKSVFSSVREIAGVNFRSAVGLAELALREGKIAYVIHHFADAAATAESRSLRRWSENEGNYFSNINSDEEYMELEVSRINALATLENLRKTASRVSFMGLPLIAIGLIFEELFVSNAGWAISGIALTTRLALSIGERMFNKRIPYEMLETDD